MKKKTLTGTELTAAFWGAAADDGVYTRLSSGVEVRVRQFPLHELLLKGTLPNSIKKTALKVYNQGTPAIASEEDLDNIRFVDYVVAYALVEPKACHGGEKEPGGFPVQKIPVSDRLEIFKLALGGVHAEREKLVPLSVAMTS